MNPAISRIAPFLNFDVSRFTWFDISFITQEIENELMNWAMINIPEYNKKMPLSGFEVPFSELAMYHSGIPFVLIYDKHATVKHTDEPTYNGAFLAFWEPNATNMFAYMQDSYENVDTHYHSRLSKEYLTPEKLGGKTEDEMTLQTTNMMLQLLSLTCLINLKAHRTEEVIECYRAKPNDKLKFLNEKRRKKNKPMILSWNTIELQPQPQRKIQAGDGTHASPARHKRRGHLRRRPDGTFKWINEMWVGKIENGMIVHDYMASKKLFEEKTHV